MIMGIWRDLAAFVLLAHLVTLSKGNSDEKRALEEILARNVTIVVIENKDDGPVDLEKLRNATTLVPGQENSTVASNVTDVVDENELVVELEEALVAAASSGQVIMIGPPADRGNSTNSLPGPVLIIETPSNTSKSLVQEAVSKKNETRKISEPNPTLDQEIAQSQKRERSKDYTNDEDLEALDDLLAITEYEPQRIDVKRGDEKIRVTSDQRNSTLQSTIHPRPEETHYDVPKQRNPPRPYQSDNLRPASVTNSSNNSSSQELQKAATSYPIHTDQKPSTSIPQEFKIDRRNPTAFNEKPNNPNQTEIIRGPRNSEIIIPLTTRPTSAPRKLTYNEITRKNGLIGAPSTIDTKSTFVPGLSGVTESRPKIINNFASTSNPSRRNLHSSRVPTTPVSLPSTYYPFLQSQTSSSFTAKTSSQPTQPSSAVPRASRRSDDYYPDYVTSTNEAPQSLTNQPLGYLTRYNQPSLVARQVSKARLHPAASEFRQAEVIKDSSGEKRSDEDSYESTSPGSSRTIPVHDEYETTRLRFGISRTTSRPPFVDYKKMYQRENQRHQPTSDYQKENLRHQPTSDYQKENLRHQPTSDYQKKSLRHQPSSDYQKDYQRENPRHQPSSDYQKDYQRENPRHQPANDHQKDYQKDNQGLQPTQSYRSVHQRPNERQQPAIDYQKVLQRTTQQQQPTIGAVDHRTSRRFSIPSRTTPSYESYEEDEDESPESKKSEEVRKPEATSQAINGILPRSTNSPGSTANPSNDSYEDDESEKPKPHQQRSSTIGTQRQRSTNPYLVPTRPAYRSSDYFSRTPQPVTPTSLVDNPIYQLHGVKTSPGPLAANAIRDPSKDHQESKTSTAAGRPERLTTRFLPRGTATSRRVVSTTPASTSYADSDQFKRPATTQRLRNRNYVDHQGDKPARNVYTDKPNPPTIATATQPGKQLTENAYDEPISDRFLAYQTKSASRLATNTPFSSERNSAAGVTSPAYRDYSGSNEDDSNDVRRYQPAATKLQALNRRANLEGEIPATASTDYESYEEGDDEENASTSGSDKLIESSTDNYGSRVRPRVVAVEGRPYGPSYSRAATTSPGGDVRTNYGGRRRDFGHVEDEPVESVHRADVQEAPYEDEVPTDSGHPEDQASHQTHAKAKKHGGGDHKHEEGGGLKHEEDHHEAHGEKGDKGYKGYHEYDKGKKGHHDKEVHDKEYDEKKGEKKKHEEEGGYHKERHHGEKGEKEAEFAEKGEHQKGHSTKGQHVVHKKDEYEKKTEFYDESHESDGDEKEGGYHHEHEHKKGGHDKKGHHDSAHHEDKYGEKGEHEKGHHYHEKKGHDGKDGKGQHHEHHEKYGKKGGHEEGSKWSHKKGDDGDGGGKKKGS